MDKPELRFLEKCFIDNEERIKNLRTKILTNQTHPSMLSNEEWAQLRIYLEDETAITNALLVALHKKTSLFQRIFKK